MMIELDFASQSSALIFQFICEHSISLLLLLIIIYIYNPSKGTAYFVAPTIITQFSTKVLRRIRVLKFLLWLISTKFRSIKSSIVQMMKSSDHSLMFLLDHNFHQILDSPCHIEQT